MRRFLANGDQGDDGSGGGPGCMRGALGSWQRCSPAALGPREAAARAPESAAPGELRVSRVPAPEGKQGVRTDRGDDFRAAGWPASQLATSASLAISPGRPRSLNAGLSDRGAAASRRVPSVADKEVFGADGHDSGRADDATSRAAGDLHDQLHGGGYGLLWRRDEHVAVSARTASSTGPIGGSSSRYSFPSESELVVAGPARLHTQRPGGRSDRVGWRLCRLRRRRSCLVPTSSQTIAGRSRRLRPGAMRALHGRGRLPAIGITRSANTQGCRPSAAYPGVRPDCRGQGLAATDRHPICTGLGLGGDDHQRYRKSADSGNR